MPTTTRRTHMLARHSVEPGAPVVVPPAGDGPDIDPDNIPF